MELNDSSSDELRDPKPAEPTRSVLGIDLNEIPSPAETLPESIDVVRSYHDHLSPPPGGPAGVPGVSRGSVCAACGKPEVRGHVVVCDGCERGFHLGCAGMRGRQAVSLDEWVCGDCMFSGVRSKRWPLGVKSKRILDINASPPSDGDAEGSEEVTDLRKHTTGGNSFGGNPFGAPVTYSNFLYTGNGFGFQKASGIVTNAVKVGLEDILHHSQTMVRSFDEVDLNSPLGRCRSSSNMAFRLPMRNPSEMFLQALRDFISERHGVLDEGWRVEFKQSMGSCDLYAVYCAPDGKTFDSVYEVACYLGLMSNYNSKQPGQGSLSIPEKTNLPRKRKATRCPITNGFAEKEAFSDGTYKELSSNGLSMGFCSSTFVNNAKLAEAGADSNGGFESQQDTEGLPVQFEDFFLLSLGKIDTRPAYHDVNCIWPVGFRSCWHDKITGSVFIFEVLDGGDCGPVFKVRRCSCSALPIPIGSTVLSRPQLGHFSCESDEENDNMTCDNEGNIQMILSDLCPPMEDDILSCLKSCSNRSADLQMSNEFNLEACLVHEKSEKILSSEMGLRDEIGEISVEEHSSTAAWRMISQKLISACSEIFKQKGTLKFFCKHVGDVEDFPNWAMKNDYGKGNYTSLDKFLSSPVSFSIPSVIQTENELETLSDLLAEWLDHDRFGVDVEFVQEILEQLPGVQSCSQYQFLSDRNSYSTSLTVGNGLLVIKKGGGIQGKEKEKLDGLFRRSKKAKLVEDHIGHQPPLGKQLCSRIPPELVGDVYQVWELLCRFYEILGLKGPLSLEELEEELINPWFDSSDHLEKFGKEIRGIHVLNPHGVECSGGQMLSSNCESGAEVSTENPHAFIHMETGAMKEAAQTKLASFTYSRCSGVALTKAHSSLLKVLVSELQSKVAAIIDPNFDSGELKPKRGRKKDVDSSSHMKKTKLAILPINELTWPELARRYILAVLSMDGNLESAEIAARESGKVFRCLQGDGGVLCGSLTGVAGMEADAILLAEAKKQIFGSLKRENDKITIEDEGSEANGPSEKNLMNNGNIPDWAQMLEPVRKLPTNVGTRIRKCVYDALDNGPPDWARKILEHSISKEVYKGNASGPTKKAVLSVLADVCGEGLPPKSDKRRKKRIVISISDVIMKQCRIVLRSAAAADDSKVFCNLLGRKLINSSDNDDEGLLGSPAMVSRPLDFRTIDLRLAAGAYGGSHEAFLEDVRELWSIVRNAYGDQPDLSELAETLSQNFESLYEKEVVTLVHKFAEYAKLESLSAERKKEIDDLLSSTSEIPKAPWDEGVCKVCGIDKDDDSVLLCDTCDAEYHTYCLNPPLARIPEGNWYCPSCIVGKRMAQDASDNIQVIQRRSGKKYQGEVTRVYMEALSHLAAKMEEKEYWEFTVDERTFLLKFLCDELLNSAVIRQHLEQCAETSSELQQKLRCLSAEWKNLKSREETMVARPAKLDPSVPNALGKVGLKEGLSTSLANQDKGLGQGHALTDRPNSFGKLTGDLPTLEGSQEGIGLSGLDGHSSGTNSECNTQTPLDKSQSKDVDAAIDDCSAAANTMDSQTNDKSSRAIELSGSNSLPHEPEGSDRAICSPGNPQEYMGRDISSLPPLDQHGQSVPLDVRSNNVAQNIPPLTVSESQTDHSELNSKNDISLLQESIISTELELLKVSLRREFLGSDSLGRLYWASATPSGHSRIIVDGGVELKNGRKMRDHREAVGKSYFLRSTVPSVVDSHLHLEGSKAGCPHQYKSNNAVAIHSPWVSYQTDAEINELVGWLKNSDPKERELKESVLHWQKLRFQCFQRNRIEDQDELAELSVAANGEKAAFSNCLITKAAALLEKRYGPCFELEISDLKKRGKKARVTNDEKMYRCECLEPIWSCRHHCFSCHKTFSNDVELESHNDGRCNSAPLTHEKGKEINDSSKVKGSLKSETNRDEFKGEMNRIDTVKPGFPELSAKLIRFQNEGLVCPYGFEEICSKFVTRDSNKDLIQEIGLIGSKGIPSFVPSVSPFVSDSTLALLSPQKDVGVQGDGTEAAERPISLGNTNKIISGHDGLYDRSPRKSSVNEIGEVLKSHRTALSRLEQIDRRPFSDGHSSVVGVGCCCVVPQSSLRPLVGKVSQISRRLKINLLDMDAMLPEEALRPSKSHLEKRWAWRAFVKSAMTLYEMVQATIVLEDMIKTEYLRNEWWYWSSFSAAAKVSTISSLALRIYALDAAIIYENFSSNLDPTDNLESSSIFEQKLVPTLDPVEKTRASRKSNKKRKEPEG